MRLCARPAKKVNARPERPETLGREARGSGLRPGCGDREVDLRYRGAACGLNLPGRFPELVLFRAVIARVDREV